MHGLFVRLKAKRQTSVSAVEREFCCVKSRSKIHIAMQYIRGRLLQQLLAAERLVF